MIQTIQEIRKEGSIRLLISSHLLRDIDQTCDEVLILKEGRVAALCNIEEERRSQRNFIELEAVGPTDEFCERLRGLGCECACFPGGRIKLVMPDAIESRDFYRGRESRRTCRFGASIAGAIRLKTSSCAPWKRSRQGGNLSDL